MDGFLESFKKGLEKRVDILQGKKKGLKKGLKRAPEGIPEGILKETFPEGALLVNMGGATSSAQLQQFLYNMFKDYRIVPSPIRHFLAPVISRTRTRKVWEKYRQIGGSPIYSLTTALCSQIEKEWKRPVLYGMRYTTPFIWDQLFLFEKVIVLPLYPHYSVTTFESALDGIKRTVAKGFRGVIGVVQPFYNHPLFNRLTADSILEQMEGEEGEWHLIFSAHGLPERLVKRNRDPYPHQVAEQVTHLKRLVGHRFKSVTLAYQSRFGFGKWLKPYLSEILPIYRKKQVAIYPISFLIDNSETDLELGIEYYHLGKEIGIRRYKLLSPPNDSPKFAQFYLRLIEEVRERLW